MPGAVRNPEIKYTQVKGFSYKNIDDEKDFMNSVVTNLQ